MKKIIIFITLFSILFACSFNVNAVESTKELTIPRVEDGTIDMLDGCEMDEAYKLCEKQELAEQNLQAFPESPQNSVGSFWAVYDSSYLYVYIEVKDEAIDYSNNNIKETWNRESIGIILDFDYIRQPEYEYNYAENGDRVAYINLSGDNIAVTYHLYAPEANNGLFDKIKKSTVSDTGDGRILYEVALPFPDDIKVEKDTKFGFEILATNAQDGTRSGVISWSPEGQAMWQYTDVCGTAFLGEISDTDVENGNGNEGSVSNQTDKETNTLKYTLIIIIAVSAVVVLAVIIAVIILIVKKGKQSN